MSELMSLLAVSCVAALLPTCNGSDDSLPIEYPYRFEIQAGSSAWIVTPELCEKTSVLVFDWDPTKACLTANGAQIHPPVEDSSPLRDEERMERIYNEFPIIREFRAQRGSWVEAVAYYNSRVEKCLRSLRDPCRMALSDSLSESDVSREYARLTSDYPDSEIFDEEMGVELGEHGFTVYLRTPQGPMAQPTRYLEPERKSRSPGEVRASADAIVDEIVAHYHLSPDLPHIAIISNGGPSLRALGVEAVENIERAIQEAQLGRTERSSSATRVVPDVILRRIAECSASKQ